MTNLVADSGATQDAPLGVVHIDLAADSFDHPPAGPALVVLWWRDLPLGRVAPSTLAAIHDEGGRSWTSAIAKEIAGGVASRLRPTAVPSWLPGLLRKPGRESEIVSAVAGPDVLGGLDAVPGVVVEPGVADDLTVVVCTRDRPASLARTLATLGLQKVTPAEIIVVDNAPANDEVRTMVERLERVRYIAEPRPGLSIARNTGLRHVTTDLVAFTDDDAEPHVAWTGQVHRVFADNPALLALTGLVLPARLDTAPAQSFEFEFGGFSRGYMTRNYDADWFQRLRRRAVPAWQIGAGANMAFRREAFAEVGGFDERLGAGAAGCSEDSELWYRLLARGHACVYEPAAVVSHHHRSQGDALERQVVAYVEGHVAALFIEFARHRHPGELARAFVNLPAYLAAEAFSHRKRPDVHLRSEFAGYRRGLRHARFALRAPEPPDVVGAVRVHQSRVPGPPLNGPATRDVIHPP